MTTSDKPAPDHPAPLCPSCTARMEQAVAEGKGGIVACNECVARADAFEAAEQARRRAEGHPAPWQWSEPHGQETLLTDANGDVVLAYGNDSTIVVASPYVREVLAAAPEMADLLRKAADLVHWLTPFAFAYATEHPGSNMPTKVDVDDVCRSSLELLARLDAARKAGG